MTSQWYEFVLLLHAGTTGAMAGIIWFVQIVHYPLYRRVSAADFAAYQADHVRRTGWVVGPLMVAEAVTASAVLAMQSVGPSVWMPWLGMALLGMIWLITFARMVPLHRRLERVRVEAMVARLIAWNWWRTIAWSGRLALALKMVADHLGDSAT